MILRLTAVLTLRASLGSVDASELRPQQLDATEREFVSWIEAHHGAAVEFLKGVGNIDSGTMNHARVREVGWVFGVGGPASASTTSRAGSGRTSPPAPLMWTRLWPASASTEMAHRDRTSG